MILKLIELFAAVCVSLWLFALHYKALGLPALDSAIIPICIMVFSIGLIFGDIGEDK